MKISIKLDQSVNRCRPFIITPRWIVRRGANGYRLTIKEITKTIKVMDGDLGEKRLCHAFNPRPLGMTGLIATIDANHAGDAPRHTLVEHVAQSALSLKKAKVFRHHHRTARILGALDNGRRFLQIAGERLLDHHGEPRVERLQRVLRLEERWTGDQHRGCLSPR